MKFKLNLKERIKRPFFWLWPCLIISVIFAIIYRSSEYYAHWAYVGMLICWIYPVLLTIVGIVFAWIINPIRALIKKIKERKG